MLKIMKMLVRPDLIPPRLTYSIPEEFWYENDPESIGVGKGLMVFYTPELDAEIDIVCSGLVEDTIENEMDSIIHACAPKEQEGPFPVSLNGMDGLGVYCSKRENQYIMLLDISGFGMVDEEGVLQEKLEITVTTREDVDVKAIVKSAEVKALVKGIAIM